MGKKMTGLNDVLFGHSKGARKSTHDKHTARRAGDSKAPGYRSGGDRKRDVRERRNKNR